MFRSCFAIHLFIIIQIVSNLLSIQVCRMWKIYFRFNLNYAERGQSTIDSSMQNVEYLISIQVNAECGQSTFDSSIMQNMENLLSIQVLCRMWTISIGFKCMQNADNLHSIQVYAECEHYTWTIYIRFKYYAEYGKSTSIQVYADLCRMWTIYFQFKSMQNADNLHSAKKFLNTTLSSNNSIII